MKPYEEIDFPNGFLRWIREDGEYVCRMTEEQMVKIKAIHESPSTWVGLTKDEMETLSYKAEGNTWIAIELAEAKLKEKNR